MTQYNEHRLNRAKETASGALDEVDRQELAAELCKKEGLAYASLTEDQLGPMLVTYQHKPIGELHTTSPSALHDWHARRYLEDGSLSDPTGPYGTARAAAASLIRGRTGLGDRYGPSLQRTTIVLRCARDTPPFQLSCSPDTCVDRLASSPCGSRSAVAASSRCRSGRPAR